MNPRSTSVYFLPRATRMPEIRIETLADTDALNARRAQWSGLWRQVPDATPFQSPAWLLCWSRHYAPDRTGAVVALQGEKLLALLPYFFWQDTLWLAGTGPSDYGDALVAPGALRVTDILLESLAEIARRRGCERIDLRQLRAGSALLAAATPAGWRSEIRADAICMSMRLRGHDGLDAASPRWRRNIARMQRKLENIGACTLESVSVAQAQNGARLLLWLHERRWAARGEAGLFEDGLLRAFMGDVIPGLSEAGLLRLYRLTCDGRVLAETFAMHAPGATHFYATGFEPAWSRYSPGLLSIAAAIRGAAAEGDHTAHFLRGCERYKYHLGASECATWRRVLEYERQPCI